ncbi:MipA/OmpV family protein, partial [Enterobacter roggenkampii]
SLGRNDLLIRTFPKYQLTQKLYLNASAVYTVLPDDVKNSPMIDRDDSFTLMTGLTWRF